MEPSRLFEDALASFEDDLDAVLELNSTLSPNENSLNKNPEELSSQGNYTGIDDNENLCESMSSLSDIPKNLPETYSQLSANNNLDSCEPQDLGSLDFTTNEHNPNSSFLQINFEDSALDDSYSSFDKEFENLDDIDFDFLSSGEEERKKETETSSTKELNNQPESTHSEASIDFNRNCMLKPRSQELCKGSDSSIDPNVSPSSPQLSNKTRDFATVSQSDTNTNNNMDFLELSHNGNNSETTKDISKTIQSSMGGTSMDVPQGIQFSRPLVRETPMNVSETIQFSQSSEKETSLDVSDIIHFPQVAEKSYSWNSIKNSPARSVGTEKPIENDETTQNPNIGQIMISTKDFTIIPKSVKKLYDIVKEEYSDFAFVYALCAQLCQDRIPMGCFVNVKMSLLLSIASIGEKDNIAPVPIIVMGNDPYMANFLLTSVADLAGRFVGPVDDTKPPSSDFFCNRKWIEADPIQLAKGGVFYAGEWTCLKTQRSEKIFKDIETSRVAVEGTTRIYPLQSAIWAHWRAMKYNSKDQQIFNKFVKIFGIPAYMDSSNYETLVDYTLKQASVEMFESSIDHLSITFDEMRTFMAAISLRTVDFTQAAIDILQKYFVASRTERPDCLTKQAFTVLKQFAESFAKLSLRLEVLTIDAVGAIYLCEHFIQHFYGVGVDPPPMLEIVGFVGDVDAFMSKFHDWVINYVTKFTGK